MVVPIVLSVTVSILGPTAVPVFEPIISAITSVAIVPSPSVVVLIPISAIQPFFWSYRYCFCNLILDSYLGKL